MAKVPEYYEIGNIQNLSVEELARIVTDMYRDLAIALNKKPDVYFRSTNGLSSDTELSNGDFNINTNTLRIEMLTQHNSSTSVTWTTIS